MNGYIKCFWISIFSILNKMKELKVGDRVKLYGGYDSHEWLNGKDAYYGAIVAFIPGPSFESILGFNIPVKAEDAVVKLDEEISYCGIKGKILILSRTFQNFWGKKGVVHVHLFNSIPQTNEWTNINKSGWDKNHIESHADYRVVTKQKN